MLVCVFSPSYSLEYRNLLVRYSRPGKGSLQTVFRPGACMIHRSFPGLVRPKREFCMLCDIFEKETTSPLAKNVFYIFIADYDLVVDTSIPYEDDACENWNNEDTTNRYHSIPGITTTSTLPQRPPPTSATTYPLPLHSSGRLHSAF